MLNEHADLVGALLDFDISVSCCAFDGNNVWIAPRAALSLVTMTQVVKPFCYQEMRNRRRIIKYFKRGFHPFLMDPNSRQTNQSLETVLPIVPLDQRFAPNDFRSKHQQVGLRRKIHHVETVSGVFMRVDGVTATEIRDFLRANRCFRQNFMQKYQRVDDVVNGSEELEEEGMIYCCCNREIPLEGINDYYHYYYSFAWSEPTNGHAMEFFAKCNEWSEEWKTVVKSVHPYRRGMCFKCRSEYVLSLVLAETTYPETVEDTLHGEVSYCQTGGSFLPSFYGGGVFDARLVKKNVLPFYKGLRSLLAQSHTERVRYVVDHGSLDGYHKRFIYGIKLDRIFDEASNMVFADSGRSPVGLNPERFISRCEVCSEWLLGYEFGETFCRTCGEKKPAAT